MCHIRESRLAMDNSSVSRNDEQASTQSLWGSGNRLVDDLTDEIRSSGCWYPSDPLSTPTGVISPMKPGWELEFSPDYMSLPPTPLDVKSKGRLSAAPPSIYCHVCGRVAYGGRVCGRYLRSLCRKVVCEKCLHRFRLEGSSDDSSWMCPHCLGTCPPKSKCYVYSKRYLKRRLASKSRKTSGQGSRKAKPDTGVKSTVKAECGK